MKKKFKDELVEKYLNSSPLIIQKYFMLVFVLFKFVFKLNITNYENQTEHKHFKLLTPMHRIDWLSDVFISLLWMYATLQSLN